MKFLNSFIYIHIVSHIHTHRINPKLPMCFLSIFGIFDMKFSNLSVILKVFNFQIKLIHVALEICGQQQIKLCY